MNEKELLELFQALADYVISTSTRMAALEILLKDSLGVTEQQIQDALRKASAGLPQGPAVRPEGQTSWLEIAETLRRLAARQQP